MVHRDCQLVSLGEVKDGLLRPAGKPFAADVVAGNLDLGSQQHQGRQNPLGTLDFPTNEVNGPLYDIPVVQGVVSEDFGSAQGVLPNRQGAEEGVRGGELVVAISSMDGNPGRHAATMKINPPLDATTRGAILVRQALGP